MTITSHLGFERGEVAFLPDAALVHLAVILVGDGKGGLLRDELKRAVGLDLRGRAQGDHVEVLLVLVQRLVGQCGKRCVVDEFHAPLPLVKVPLKIP